MKPQKTAGWRTDNTSRPDLEPTWRPAGHQDKKLSFPPCGRTYARHLLNAVDILERTAMRIETLKRIEAELGAGCFADEPIGDLLDWFFPERARPPLLEHCGTSPLPEPQVKLARTALQPHTHEHEHEQSKSGLQVHAATAPADEEFSPEHWRAVWDGYRREKQLQQRSLARLAKAEGKSTTTATQASTPLLPPGQQQALRPDKQPGSKNRYHRLPAPSGHERQTPEEIRRERPHRGTQQSDLPLHRRRQMTVPGCVGDA